MNCYETDQHIQKHKQITARQSVDTAAVAISKQPDITNEGHFHPCFEWTLSIEGIFEGIIFHNWHTSLHTYSSTVLNP